MPLIGGDSIYRVIDYLDKQTVREKEKRNETFLKVLPTYLERQLSGITDEKTLFSTIPQLSAKMYAFGPQVGQAANQILGNLASSKYKEIALNKEENQRQATLDITKEIAGNSGVDLGGILDKLNKGDIPTEAIPGLVDSYVKTHRTVETGSLYKDNGKTFYEAYQQDAYGNVKSRQTFQFNPSKDGKYTKDIVGTPGIEALDLSPQEMEALSKQLDAEQKVKDELNLYRQKLDMADQKQKDTYREQIRKKQYKDIKTGEPIFADVGDDGMPYLYKNVETPTQRLGKLVLDKEGKPYFGTTKEKQIVTDYTNVEDLAQGLPADKKPNEMTSSDVRLETEKANLYMKNIAGYMVAQGYATDAQLRDPYTGYYKPDVLLKLAEENNTDPNLAGVKEEIARLNLQGAGVLTGGQKPTTQKPKW